MNITNGKMKKMVKYIKEKLPKTFLIGGNVSTPDAVIDLQEWGCDAIKCGISGGSACTTYHSTGFGNRGWQANMILDCCRVSKVPIIADGSIRQHSDIVKSLVLGATMVMVGGMLAGYEESPVKKVKNISPRTNLRFILSNSKLLIISTQIMISDKLKVFLQSVMANLLMSVRGNNSRSSKFNEDKLIIIIENPRITIHFIEFLIPF